MGWTELPQGQDVMIKGGYSYAVVAQVKDNHDAASIKSLIASKGLTLFDYRDPATSYTVPDGYRVVAVEAYAQNDAGTVPWGVPWPLSIADDSHILRVWAATGSDQPLPTSPPATPWGWILLGLAGAGGATWWWLRHKRKRA